MAIPKIKATYSLDVETTRELAELARRWSTTKSGALRRVINEAAASTRPTRLQAFRALQQSLALSEEKANIWIREIRAERDAGRPRTDG